MSTVFSTASGSYPVEPKVWAGTFMGVVAGVVFAIFNAVQANSHILAPLPQWAQFVLLAGTPPLATFLAAYSADHQYRQGEPVQG